MRRGEREEENAGLSERDASTVAFTASPRRGCTGAVLTETRASGFPSQPSKAQFTFPHSCFVQREIRAESVRSRILLTCAKASESLARCSTAGKEGQRTQLDWKVGKDQVVGSRRLKKIRLLFLLFRTLSSFCSASGVTIEFGVLFFFFLFCNPLSGAALQFLTGKPA